MSLPYVKLFPLEMLEQMELLEDRERGVLFTGILEYVSKEVEPQFTGNERFIWPAVRQQLVRNQQAYDKTVERNRANGVKGGRPKKEPQASEKPSGFSGFSSDTQTSQEQEQEQEQYQEQYQDQDHDQGKASAKWQKPSASAESPQGGAVAEVAEVASYYLSRVNEFASEDCLRSLAQYEAQLSTAVVYKAIDIALDQGKRSWPYIQGILRRFVSQGITSLERLEAQEQRRLTQGGGYNQGYASKPYASTSYSSTSIADHDMEVMRAALKKWGYESSD